ncbi:MAG TPA: DUF1566 domain-containing protein, partial [Terriglobales bacterium]|nr:DUF1566 domain-containing protein [Terriglobales bacterium]
TLAAAASAQGASSLGKCQKVMASEGGKYIRAVADTVGKCLHQVSLAVIVDGGAPSEAAGICAKSLLKLQSSAAPEKTLSAKFNAKVGKACDPTLNPGLLHGESDLYSIGATTLSAARLNAYCQRFGGDGTIDSFDDWRDCVRAAADCLARQAIATQWPRILEYTQGLLAAAPITENADALAALTEIDTAIEGATDDGVPDITCGALDGICGDGLINVAGEQCDGAALAGTSCTSLGFSGGTLACSGCTFDTSGCSLATGNAAAGDVLASKTFSNAGAIGLTGTMPDNGAVTITPGVANQAIAAGYHNGAGFCAGDADLISGNLKSGANIFGITGSVIQASGAAAAADVLSGQTFSNAGAAGLTGTMPNNGAVTFTPGTANQAIAAGYHNGSGFCSGDADLIAANIKSGANLFGVAGTVIQASGGAAAADVLAGQSFSNASAAGLTGTMPNNGAAAITPGTADQTIAAGYHNGSGFCAGDADLAEENIASEAVLFGIEGIVQRGPLKTGVINSNGPGSDGELQMGAGFQYTNDFDDGTITDHTTGLMWEKKSDDGSVHDVHNTYTWGNTPSMNGTMVTEFLAALNTPPGFAGYTDWRIPNVNELLTLARYDWSQPRIAPMFNAPCFAGCTVLDCSCTASDYYWTSTTTQSVDDFAHAVKFSGDGPYMDPVSTDARHVRAVRGGNKGCSRCANEPGTCTFSGTKRVRYGANGKYHDGTFSSPVSCSNTTFGDPAPGVAKHCDVCDL